MFTCSEIVQATGGKVVAGNGEMEVDGVSTDTRSIESGELFVPLHGANYDGHTFLLLAAERGAAAALVEQAWLDGHQPPTSLTCIVVKDSLRALGDLAVLHRRRLDIPVVGVTGSNGKTSTKEMLASILMGRGPGLKTSGNLNNLIGVPQMILQFTSEHRWGALEMGMSEPGEIDRLAEIAAPDVGVITNAFPAHLESMGSMEAVARAKGELFMRLKAGGWAIYNADDPLVSALPVAEGVKRLSFGLHGAEVTASRIVNAGHAGQRFVLTLPGIEIPVQLKAYGRHNIQNALAAAAAAWAVGTSAAEICKGLEAFCPVARRFSLEELGSVTLIDDSYNANPGSMAAGLVTLSELKGEGRAIAVLGDMLELGSGSIDAHRGVGRLAATCVCRLYLLGRFAETVKTGALEGGMSEESIVVAESREQLLADLRGNLVDGDCVLVKGSRGMRMEGVVEGIRTWRASASGKGDN